MNVKERLGLFAFKKEQGKKSSNLVVMMRSRDQAAVFVMAVRATRTTIACLVRVQRLQNMMIWIHALVVVAQVRHSVVRVVELDVVEKRCAVSHRATTLAFNLAHVVLEAKGIATGAVFHLGCASKARWEVVEIEVPAGEFQRHFLVPNLDETQFLTSRTLQ